MLIIVAAEADGKRIGRIRMALIEDFDRKTLHRLIEDNIELGSMVCTDGLNSYRELNGYIHNRKVQNLRQGGEPLLPRVHLVISLLKRWLLGTLQGSASDKYLDDYLNELSFTLIDGDLPHAESFSIVWLNRPSTPTGDILEAHKPEDLVPGGVKCIPRCFVDDGTILVTRSGSVGRPTLAYSVHRVVVISDDLLRIKPIEKKNLGWIYAFLHAPQLGR